MFRRIVNESSWTVVIKLNVLVLYILAFAEGSNNWLINDWPNGKIFLPCSHLKLYIVKNGKAISPAILFFEYSWSYYSFLHFIHIDSPSIDIFNSDVVDVTEIISYEAYRSPAT